MVRVKVCCISTVEEMGLAVGAGADAIGLVSGMSTGHGVLTLDRIRQIAALTPPPVARFLLTQHLDAEGIVADVAAAGVDTVQICDHVPVATLRAVRERCAARVVAVVHASADGAEAYAEQAAEAAHALLLDSGRPGADFEELGGTGRTHDWDVSRRIVDRSPVPVWLAGGLDSDNVQRAIATVRPFGVDLCTGVRTRGRLDPHRLERFLGAVRTA